MLSNTASYMRYALGVCLVLMVPLFGQISGEFMSELVGKIQSDETLSSQEKDDWIFIAREVFEQFTVNIQDSPRYAEIAYAILSDARFNGVSTTVAVNTAREALSAISKKAPVEDVEELCRLSFVLPLNAGQFEAYAQAIKKSRESGFPLDITQEVIRISAEDRWDMSTFKTIFDGLLKGFSHNLSAEKLAVFMMVSVKQNLGTPEQIVNDAIEAIKGQEPEKFKVIPRKLEPIPPKFIFPELRKVQLDLGRFRQSIESFVGTPYLWGGNTRQGVDCSGFTKGVLREIGINLPRVSRDQAKCGVAVPEKSIRLGDLVFFDTKGRGIVTHVGVYLGGDVVVHSGCSRGVTYVLLQDKYFRQRFLFSKRIVEFY